MVDKYNSITKRMNDIKGQVEHSFDAEQLYDELSQQLADMKEPYEALSDEIAQREQHISNLEKGLSLPYYEGQFKIKWKGGKPELDGRGNVIYDLDNDGNLQPLRDDANSQGKAFHRYDSKDYEYTDDPNHIAVPPTRPTTQIGTASAIGKGRRGFHRDDDLILSEPYIPDYADWRKSGY